MADFGLAEFLARAEAGDAQVKEARKLLKQELGWLKDAPTVYFMAKATGEEKRYNFLYHATSGAVHFSVGELSRRAWGIPGQMQMGFGAFERYWATFSISWGWRLYAETLALIRDSVMIPLKETPLDAASHDRLMELAKRIGAVPPIQIITAEELAWPFEENIR